MFNWTCTCCCCCFLLSMWYGKWFQWILYYFILFYFIQREAKFLKLVMPTWIFCAKLALHTQCACTWACVYVLVVHCVCIICLFIMCWHFKLLRKLLRKEWNGPKVGDEYKFYWHLIIIIVKSIENNAIMTTQKQWRRRMVMMTTPAAAAAAAAKFVVLLLPWHLPHFWETWLFPLWIYVVKLSTNLPIGATHHQAHTN